MVGGILVFYTYHTACGEDIEEYYYYGELMLFRIARIEINVHAGLIQCHTFSKSTIAHVEHLNTSAATYLSETGSG